MTEAYNSLATLLSTRWEEACSIFPELQHFSPTWEIGESEHFKQTRGFATTTTDGTFFHLKLAEKILVCPLQRQDAIVRHEIGHIVDFSRVEVPPGLPFTAERRADAIAEMIWGDTIRYDAEGVQTLNPTGVAPRPEYLGL